MKVNFLYLLITYGDQVGNQQENMQIAEVITNHSP